MKEKVTVKEKTTKEYREEIVRVHGSKYIGQNSNFCNMLRKLVAKAEEDKQKVLLQKVLEIIESQLYTQEQIEAEPILAMQDEMIHENRGVHKVLTSILKI